MPALGMVPRSLFLLCCILGFLIFSKRVTSLNFVGSHCQNTTDNPKASSAYSASLNVLLSSLSSNASHTINGFSNSTAGHNISDRVYGLFLCRGDLSSDVCKQCVVDASNRILNICSKEKTAIVWYDECLLRYSNEFMFSRGDASFWIFLSSLQNVTQPDLFNPLLQNLMNKVTNQAANDGSGKKFAVEEANFSSFQRLYTLAQCTPDLSSFDCLVCLRNGISILPSCCDNRQGGRVIFPSCNIRYELYRFYNIVTPASNLPPSLPPSSTPSSSKEKGKISREVIVPIVIPIIVSVLLFCVALFFLRRRLRERSDRVVEATGGSEILDAESLQYNLSEIQAATNNFSACNRIGEGGFGPVYKGTLHNGQDIAVKRLSSSSLQGFEEFRNEIVLVANLHHRNLVRLLGYCFHGEEKLLIYEFVPNKSLDYFLFDPERQPVLDWSRRYKIIGGLARGLLYLHEESRLRIVHRDLKASNVLLNEGMNPKISDFGLARICAVDQSEGSTSKIAGTYGYMAPEYAMRGQFSIKSDVFSFGVLVLEIISGKRNSSFHESDGAEDLLSYAWKQWRDGTPVALLDSSVGDSSSRNEVLQCIHIGLLCVQEDAEQRPSMATVVLMLDSHSATLPAPNQPPFLCHSRT